ncbi:MAG: hypothetical protein J7L39_03200 [Candidatus Aenigmarchaeota archaeon]|nr:hypothetical protein [Candidatus Aenigmarchaeota archaeon]
MKKQKKNSNNLPVEALHLRRDGSSVYGITSSGKLIYFDVTTQKPYEKFDNQTGKKYVWDEKELEILIREQKAYVEGREAMEKQLQRRARKDEIKELLEEIIGNELEEIIKNAIYTFLNSEEVVFTQAPGSSFSFELLPLLKRVFNRLKKACGSKNNNG